MDSFFYIAHKPNQDEVSLPVTSANGHLLLGVADM